MKLDFDYLVVGAGSAGCALAYRLAMKNRGAAVGLVEAGGRGRQPMVQIPLGFAFLLGKNSGNWGYESEAVPGLQNRRLNLPRGKMLGGTSSLNGMVYIRGQRQDFDGWAAAGNQGWSYDEVLPYFLKSEDSYREAGRFHGKGGPLDVSPVSDALPITEAFITAACNYGLPRNADFNGAEQLGVGLFDANTRNGRRHSSAHAFLGKMARPRNLSVLTGLQTDSVIWQGNRAIGLRCRRGSVALKLQANSEIILCAGVFNTPKILELSGVGDPERLRGLGIPIVSPLTGVGENLQDHLNMYVESEVRGERSYYDYVNSWRFLPTAAKWVFLRKGILANPAAVAGAFLTTVPGAERPDVQLHFAAAASRPDKNGWMRPIQATTAAACLIQPSSRGSCHVATADPRQPPRIQPNYLHTEDDRARSIRALRALREIMNTAPFADFVTSELRPGAALQSDEELLAHIQTNAESVHHAAGTCRMGHDEQAVVSQELKVHGTEGLRLADASVMPNVTSGNTHATCVMIAEKAADLIDS